ncbi:hypothetical protein AX14_006866 [Amanita brunnescens Koide BX004]|nr:hypothetical protein AX14_006866 [Amanita brunnescens Koide BX004]
MPIEHLGDRVVVKHPMGASAEILLYGATVISWKSGNHKDHTPVERLFVSSKSKLDGSKPVRGGIPIVFPCFGPPAHPEHSQLSQHGFARNQIWEWDGTIEDNETEVSAKFSLKPTPVIQSIYERPFHLHYIVTIAKHQLSTDLHVENASTGDMEFQALFHNYIRAPSDEVVVTPLQHLVYFDKTDTSADGQPKQKIESRPAVDVRRGTDSVFENAPQDYEIKWGSSGVGIKTVNLKDVVVWNPQDEGRKMTDMEEGGWKNYICVEPGFVRGFVQLRAGERWIGQQVLSVIESED